MKFRDTCTGFLLNSEKSMNSWRSCDFLDRSESRRIQGRNARKFPERSEFQKKNVWFHVNPPTAPSAGQNKGEMSCAELLKIVVRLVFWREIKIFMKFDGKSGPFGWAFKGSAAFTVISCEIHEITRPAFAKTHLAGKLKGLGDVRNRWEIDEIAPSRQEGLLAVFLRRNRR